MAKKKSSSKKKSVGKKKAAARRKTVRRKPAPRKKLAPKRKSAPREITSGTERSTLGPGVVRGERARPRRGIGDESAGQSGDVQGLSRDEISNAESVEELMEEGQSFEAEVVDAVELTPDADQGEVRTHERPADEISPDDGDS